MGEAILFLWSASWVAARSFLPPSLDRRQRPATIVGPIFAHSVASTLPKRPATTSVSPEPEVFGPVLYKIGPVGEYASAAWFRFRINRFNYWLIAGLACHKLRQYPHQSTKPRVSVVPLQEQGPIPATIIPHSPGPPDGSTPTATRNATFPVLSLFFIEPNQIRRGQLPADAVTC